MAICMLSTPPKIGLLGRKQKWGLELSQGLWTTLIDHLRIHSPRFQIIPQLQCLKPNVSSFLVDFMVGMGRSVGQTRPWQRRPAARYPIEREGKLRPCRIRFHVRDREENLAAFKGRRRNDRCAEEPRRCSLLPDQHSSNHAEVKTIRFW